jgi:uncharacterized protein YjiS (DUF1127 family)
MENAMSAITNVSMPVSQPLGRIARPLWAALVRGLKRVAQAYRNRNSAAVLAGLDDRMLADIGLTRSDVRDAFAEPLWNDPTYLLRARALERRLNRHRVAFGLNEAWLAAPPLAPTDWAAHPATGRPACHTV